MRIDNRSGGLRPPQQTKIPLARLYYSIWCCGGRRPPLRKRCSSCSGKRQSRAETTAPPGDSGGIQTHDLQNFFSTKSFCSKNKISTHKTKKVQLRQLHPLGDSGGIQTHDLQNFFSTKSFCSKNKISTHKTKKEGVSKLSYSKKITKP